MRSAIAILFVALLSSGCASDRDDDTCRGSGGGGPRDVTGHPVTNPHTQKLHPLYCAGETTPFQWGDRVLAVTSIKDHKGFFLYDLLAAQKIGTVPVLGGDFAFVSAILDNGTLYVYGTTGSVGVGVAVTTPGNAVKMVKTTDLVTWSDPVIVYQAAPDVTIYNTSVTRGPDGFVMTMEIAMPGTVFGHPRYSLIFARGVPEAFTDAGSMFSPQPLYYAACPSIRYVGGYYYVLYISRQEPGWMVFVGRSADLSTWELQASPYAALSPVNGADFEYHNGIAATNNSDVDLYELDGQTFLVYLYGNQGSVNYLALARYDGTMDEYFASFF